MSGFAAVFDRGAGGDLPAIAETLSAALKHRGGITQSFDLSDGAAAVATRDYKQGIYRTLVEGDDARVVIFDGFLFNEAELCARFETRSLGEAIWRGFRRGGNDWFAELDGSFAIVIHDRRRDSFHLVRDRFGHRPLLTARAGEQVLFASEAKAFLAHPGFTRRLNREVLPAALSYGLVLGPETLFEGVEKCLPGHVCELRQGEPARHAVYYRPNLEIDETRTLPELKDAIDEQLAETIGGYNRRCGRLGIFLSGGIDSALLAVKLSAVSDKGGHAISFGASGWPAEETEAAREVAQRLGLPFTRAWADGDFEALSHLRDAVWHLEAPTRFENAMALEVASKTASGLVDGVVTGQGGGSFFGNRQHLTIRRAHKIAKLPRPLRGAAGAFCEHLPGKFMESAAFFLQRETIEQYFRRLYLWSPELACPESRLPGAGSALGPLEDVCGDYDPITALTLINFMGFWHCWIERLEGIGAAHGLDMVHPIHRNKTLELALTTPYRIKAMNRGKLFKPSLTELVADNLGSDAAERPKKALDAPFGLWLDQPSPLKDAALSLRGKDSLFRDHLDGTGPDQVLARFAEGGSGDAATRKSIYTLLSFEIWLQQFMDGRQNA